MKKIVIYSQEGCAYCAELKNLLEQNGIPFVVSDIDEKKEDWKVISENSGNGTTWLGRRVGDFWR